MIRYEYHRPRSLTDAFALKSRHPEAQFIAGGTDLLVKIKNREVRPGTLISLRSLPELQGIEEGPVTRIRAGTTISEIAAHPGLSKAYPALVQAANRLGSVQIRNQATIGGNLCNCSPCADTATPLQVYEARVVLQGPEGSREVPIEEFFVGPGQTCSPPDGILTEVLLSPPPEGSRAVFLKKGRVKMDLAIASVCVLLQLEGDLCKHARLAAGSVAPVPLRLKEVEKLLEGKTLIPELITEAGDTAARCVAPISDIRASEEYRRQIIAVYVRRAIGQLMAGGRS